MTSIRLSAYAISALAVACFFLFPEPNLALIGALLLQTLAYIVVAGKSTPDGIVLTGITILLIGSLPADHPLIREPFFENIRLWIILIGVVVVMSGLLLLGWRRLPRHWFSGR